MLEHQETFLQIVNDIIKARSFPPDWKQTSLFLIEKPKKDTTVELSYRPIFLLNILGKIAEQLICDRIYKELEAEKDRPNNSSVSRKASAPRTC